MTNKNSKAIVATTGFATRKFNTRKEYKAFRQERNRSVSESAKTIPSFGNNFKNLEHLFFLRDAMAFAEGKIS